MTRQGWLDAFWPKHLAIEHTALIPKGRFLTVAMIGRCIDQADLPRDSRRIRSAQFTRWHVPVAQNMRTVTL